MLHLYNIHEISRRTKTKDWIEYFAEFGVPDCACGCGKKVQLHRRQLRYNLFAIDCSNSAKFRNPACPEFYLFKGLSVDDSIAAVRKIQGGRKIEKDRKHMLQRINNGQNNPMSVSSIKKRTGWETHLVKEFLKGRASYGFKGKKHRPESLAKLAAQRAKQCKIVTKPEMAIWGMLYGLGVGFKYQEPIDRYVVDFLCGKTIIEVFGDYWHGRKERVVADDEKFAKLRNLGYDIQVLWESEIWLQPLLVIERLRELI
jgi:very-short-patch-repair endonuclease